MYIPELESVIVFSDKIEEFAKEALVILQEKYKKSKQIKIFDPLSKSLNSMKDLNRTQKACLKVLAKKIYQSQAELSEETKDTIANIWLPVELENSVKHKAELMKPIGQYLNNKDESAIPKHIRYEIRKNNDGKEYKVWFTSNIRWGSQDQSIYWIRQLFNLLNLDVIPNNLSSNSWLLSPETCSILLGILAFSSIQTPTPEEMLENLANDDINPQPSLDKSHLEEISLLKQQLAEANKRIKELEKQVKEDHVKIEQQEVEISLYSNKLEQLNIKSERIKKHFPLVDEFLEQIQKLCLKVAKNGGFSSESKKIKHMIEHNSTPLLVKKHSWKSKELKERWVDNCEKSFYFSQEDMASLERGMPTIFRCLLGQEPLGTGGFRYSVDLLDITLWFASKLSSYNPARVKGTCFVRMMRSLDEQKEMFWQSEPLPLKPIMVA